MRKYGYKIIEIKKEDSASAMSEILTNALPYISASAEESCLKIKILSKHEENFKKAFENKHITASFGESKGFFAKISRYFKRYGFIFGIILMLVCVYLSSLFVWRIEIDGNIEASDEEVIELLKSSGISLGTFIPGINYDDVHNKFLLNSDKIAWISVNIQGNVAKVSVREKLSEKKKQYPTHTNVLAKCDAQIYQIRLLNGKTVISVGDIVKKGDLLVSGVINSQSQGVRYVDANAEILAYVNKEINVKIPFKISEKEYKSKDFSEKYIIFFTNSINFSLKYRNQGSLYDTIETRRRVRLFNNIELPIEILSKTYREYDLIERQRSYKEAVDIAFIELEKELSSTLECSTLIKKEINTSWDENFFYISCDLYCIEDIAELIEFEIN